MNAKSLDGHVNTDTGNCSRIKTQLFSKGGNEERGMMSRGHCCRKCPETKVLLGKDLSKPSPNQSRKGWSNQMVRWLKGPTVLRRVREWSTCLGSAVALLPGDYFSQTPSLPKRCSLRFIFNF